MATGTCVSEPNSNPFSKRVSFKPVRSNSESEIDHDKDKEFGLEFSEEPLPYLSIES